MLMAILNQPPLAAVPEQPACAGQWRHFCILCMLSDIREESALNAATDGTNTSISVPHMNAQYNAVHCFNRISICVLR